MMKWILLLAILCVAIPAVAEPDASRTGLHTDALGFTLPPGPRPERIVSLSPNLTEILFAIGVEKERVIGVTRFCDYPRQVDEIDKIGGIVDPSIEVILSLRPDLVLATRGNPAVILDRLRATGLTVFAFDSQDGLERVLETMQTMVEIVRPGNIDLSERALAGFRFQLECLRGISTTIPNSARPTVYYYDPVSPDWTAGPGTHVSEAISMAGGRNLADDAKTAWPRYAVEILLVRQPDVILVAQAEVDSGTTVSDLIGELQVRPGWRDLDAVRERKLCYLPADWLLRPGPRVLRAVNALGKCLHPERSWECDR